MQSKNHHGFIVTSPSGNVSLKELPLPTYATIALASKAGKLSKKPFVIISASKFYRTTFGQTILNLSARQKRPGNMLKDFVTKLHAPQFQAAVVQLEEIKPKPNALTNLLNRIKEAKQNKLLDAKVKRDTQQAHPSISREEKARLASAKLMPTTIERETNAHRSLADHSHLSKAFVSSGNSEAKPLSDSDLFHLFSEQPPEVQHCIDTSAKFHWNRIRINKLVKSGSLESLLVLFRAGKLPEKVRSYQKLRKLLTK